jgi:hypothetical protein
MTEVEGARAERKRGEILEKVQTLLRVAQSSNEFRVALAADLAHLARDVWGTAS